MPRNDKNLPMQQPRTQGHHPQLIAQWRHLSRLVFAEGYGGFCEEIWLPEQCGIVHRNYAMSNALK
jgi:hypothetical protein